MILTDYEKALLLYYQDNYNAKWIKVFNNQHVILETKINFYNTYKRILKNQPITGEVTYTNLFYNLSENTWYYISDLLR